MVANVIRTKVKSSSKRVTPISVGKPLSRGFTDFNRRFILVKELRNGMIVRKKRTGELLKVYGDKLGRTVIEPYTQ